jgi:hypothetical protein
MQTVEIRKWDDIEHKQGRKTPATRTVKLALDGLSVTLDLSEENYRLLCEGMALFLEAGRREAKTGSATSRATPVTPEMRRWCEANGYPASAKGYIPVAGRAAYLAWLAKQALPAGAAAQV